MLVWEIRRKGKTGSEYRMRAWATIRLEDRKEAMMDKANFYVGSQ